MGEPDFKGHARREAAAILLGATGRYHDTLPYDMYVELLAIAWLSGGIYGAHGELYGMEDALAEVKAGLAA